MGWIKRKLIGKVIVNETISDSEPLRRGEVLLSKNYLLNATYPNVPERPYMVPRSGFWMGPGSSYILSGTGVMVSSAGFPTITPFSDFQPDVLRQADGFEIKKEDDQVKVVLDKEPAKIKKRSLSF